MRGDRGAGATKVLVADLDAIGFRDGADPWLPVSRSAAVAAGDESHRLFSTPRRGPRRSARANDRHGRARPYRTTEETP